MSVSQYTSLRFVGTHVDQCRSPNVVRDTLERELKGVAQQSEESRD